MEKELLLTQSRSLESGLSVWKAILVGWLWVNLPAVIIMLGSLLISVITGPGIGLILFSLGFFLGWWSYTVPRWRRWALRKGAPADKLQTVAVITLLTWPKGWIFEKTESKIDD